MRAVRKTYTLRTQLIIFTTVLFLLQSFAIAAVLYSSSFFNILNANTYRLFDSTVNMCAQSFDYSVGFLASNISKQAEILSEAFNGISDSHNIAPDEFYINDEIYNEIALAGTDILIQILQSNSVSGAFFMLNGSNANKDDENSHSSVYIRNASAEKTGYTLEIGPAFVLQSYEITSSENRASDIFLPTDNPDAFALYNNPCQAGLDYPGEKHEFYGYWSAPVSILTDNQKAIYYSIPLLDTNGNPYGILGIDISFSHFEQYYLPNTDLAYRDGFYAVTKIKDNSLDLSWIIPSGSSASEYLKTGGVLPLSAVGNDLYKTTLDDFGEVYCSIHNLTLYSPNSPFYDIGWSLVGFASGQALHKNSDNVRLILKASILCISISAYILIILAIYFMTKKIYGRETYKTSLAPGKEIIVNRTGIYETDDLADEFSELNKRADNSSKTLSEILKLMLIPIGGFDAARDNPYVTLTEYVYSLIGVLENVEITKHEWEDYFNKLTKYPMEGYENIYKYKGNTIGDVKWLRILINSSENGNSGIILDVTADIERQLQMARELDYDSLTKLYNRNAFKREVYKLIQSKPGYIGAMIFSDLDNLKYANDTFGHELGDKLIIRAGEMFEEFEKYGAIVSRISGDEFAVYLHGYDTIEALRKIILKQFRDNGNHSIVLPDGSALRVCSSSGIAWYPKDSDNVTDLLKLSDFAMYEAKHNRKGTVFEFDRMLYQKNTYLFDNREALNKLLEKSLIRFAYQPIVDLNNGEIFAYEFFMRSLSESFQSPMEILIVAGTQSKLEQLERLVIMKAFEIISEYADWMGDIKFFINSIPSQFLTPEDHSLLIEKYESYFDRIVIEVIEEENNGLQNINKKINFIRQTGMLFAVDNYGSAYSENSKLLCTMPDIIKIGISTVSEIYKNSDKQLMVKNLVAYYRPKGIRIVAEGVEKYDDLLMLKKIGVDFAQGYYLGRPAYEFLDIPSAIKEEIRRL